MKLKGKTALVTGGGAGIGLAITRAFRKAGAHVVIVGRDAARLERVRAELGEVTVLSADLGREEDRERLLASLAVLDRPLDILVNNAGTMQYFPLADSQALERLDTELALDLHAPIHLATALLPALLARPEAAIVNVSSGLIYAPFGSTPGYSAAKAGVHGFTRALRWQTRQSRLRVLELMPPTVDTEMNSHYEGPKMAPDRIARALVNGLRGRAEEIRPGQSQLLYAMSRIAPGFIFRTLNNAVERSARH